MLGSLISKKSTSQHEPRPGSAAGSRDRDDAEKQARVRLAAFMSVEVQGKGPNNVLIKAPVYTVDS
jgi:hypothetical protein